MSHFDPRSGIEQKAALVDHFPQLIETHPVQHCVLIVGNVAEGKHNVGPRAHQLLRGVLQEGFRDRESAAGCGSDQNAIEGLFDPDLGPHLRGHITVGCDQGKDGQGLDDFLEKPGAQKVLDKELNERSTLHPALPPPGEGGRTRTSTQSRDRP